MASTQNLSFAIKAVNEASATLKTVQGDIDKVTDTAEKGTSKVGGWGTALKNSATIAAGVGIQRGLASLPGMLLGAAEAAIEDAAATDRLNKSLENYLVTLGETDMAQGMKELTGDVNERIAAGQKLAFTDDEVRDSLQALLAATGDYGEATKRQAAAMDLARGANIPLAAATKLLGKLNEENVEVFKRMGIVIGENATEADALAAVQAKFGGQADTYAKSTAGQFEAAKIQLSEVKESIGTALIPVILKLAPIVLKVVDALSKMSPAVLAIVVGVGALLPILVPILALLPAIAAGFALLVSPIGLVILAIAAIIAIGVLLYKNWDTIKEKAGQLKDWIVDTFTSLPGFIKGPLESVARILLAPFLAVKKAIDAILSLKDKLTGGGDDEKVSDAREKYGITSETQFGSASGGEFAEGGIVPGPMGSRQHIIAHGGEIILPTHKPSFGGLGGGNTYVTNNYTIQGFGTSAEVARFILQTLNGEQRRGALGLT